MIIDQQVRNLMSNVLWSICRIPKVDLESREVDLQCHPSYPVYEAAFLRALNVSRR
jgi:hypothetical protein